MSHKAKPEMSASASHLLDGAVVQRKRDARCHLAARASTNVNASLVLFLGLGETEDEGQACVRLDASVQAARKSMHHRHKSGGQRSEMECEEERNA